MTTRILFLFFLCLSFSLNAQVPSSFNYQGIARLSGGVLANKTISVSIEILDGNDNQIFSELHTTNTNSYGVFSLAIGTVNAPLFNNVDWYAARKIRSSFSYNAQNVMTIDDLKSVPFAQLAQNSINADNATRATTAGRADVATNATNISNGGTASYTAALHEFNGGGISINGGTGFGGQDYVYYKRGNGGGVTIETDPDTGMRIWDSSIGVVGGGNGTYSIRATNRILCPEFDAISDERAKKDIIQSNSKADLSNLKKLSIKNFKYKDVVANSSKLKKGFIAQEVQQVFPESVNQITDFIPNIYQIGKNIRTNDLEKTLTVTVDSLSDVKIGDKIRLIGRNQNEVEVTAIEGTTFTVKGWTEKETKEVFVYGKQVNDFHVVDYDRIFTLNVSATQALIQEVEDLKEQANKLEAQNKALQKTNTMLVKKFDNLESRLTQLEQTADKATTPTPVNGQGSKTKPKR